MQLVKLTNSENVGHFLTRDQHILAVQHAFLPTPIMTCLLNIRSLNFFLFKIFLKFYLFIFYNLFPIYIYSTLIRNKK